MSADRIKVIYIAGDNHCGSTIVGRVLGQLDGCFMAGEIRDLWSRGVKDRVECSCGQPIPECEVWGRVLARSSGEPLPDAQAMIDLQWEPTRSRHIGVMMLPDRKRRLERRWADLIAYTARLYRTIVEVTGCRVIVDTSKAPFYGLMLGLVPEIDLRYIHLVRDPRGSAFSWFQRRIQSAKKKGLEHHGRPSEPAISLRWAALNVLSEFVGGCTDASMRLRYEDFLRDAGGTIEQIARFAGEPAPRQPLVIDHSVEIQQGHIGLGNPSRMDAGRVALRRDDRWVAGMSGLDKVLVSGLTLPLFIRYGYSGKG